MYEFHFPFAYWPTSQINAKSLFLLYWDAVYTLDSRLNSTHTCASVTEPRPIEHSSETTLKMMMMQMRLFYCTESRNRGTTSPYEGSICTKKCKFPRNVVKFSTISYVFLYPKSQKFPSKWQNFLGITFPNSPLFRAMSICKNLKLSISSIYIFQKVLISSLPILPHR